MAMDKDLNVIDLFGGLDDLKNKVIRTVYEPQKRFTEDALRMLRAAYFAAKLGFKIETNTLTGMRKCSYLVQNLSNDRVSWELEKLINSPHAEIGISYLIESNIAPYLFNFKNGIFLFKEKKLDKVSWPVFLGISYFNEPDELQKIHLKSNLNNQVTLAIKLAKENPKNEFSRLTLFEYGLATIQIANMINVILFNSKDKAKHIDSEYQNLPIHSISELAINGQDVIENVVIKDNRMISEILQEIKRLVLIEKVDNKKECILKYIKKHY